MKTTLTLSLMIAIIGGTSLAQSATNNEMAIRARIDAVAIDFAKGGRRAQKWTSRKLSDVVPASEISKIILLKGETSAPGEIDIYMIYRMLDTNSVFYEHDTKHQGMNTIYEAVILMENQSVFLLQIGRGEIGHGEARLISQDYDYGYFK